jgi:glycosyltransferase involved in cell wall biosynthesis
VALAARSDVTFRAVTVVIPTHNRRVLLSRTLRCVLAQQDVHLQVIVVDDGSTDDTAAYLATLTDARIRSVHVQEAGGVAAARNAGLELAQHQWVAFVDDDDLWSPRRLSNQLDALQSSGAGWACSDAVLVDRRMSVLGVQLAPRGGEPARDVLRTNIVPGGASSAIADTRTVRDLGGFDVSLNPVADWELWMRLAQAAPLVGVPHPDVGYYLHPGSMSTDVERMTRARDAALRKHEALRRAAEVPVDDDWWQSYVLSLHLGSGNRLRAMTCKLRMAQKGGGWTHLAGAVPALVAPRAVEQRQRRRQLRAYDPALLAEAESWLRGLRSG